MSTAGAAGGNEYVAVALEFVPADVESADPFAVAEEAGQSVEALRRQGYAVERRATGERGGEYYALAQQLGQMVADHKDELLALAKLVTPVVSYLFGRLARRDKETGDRISSAGQSDERAQLVVLEVDGTPIGFTAADLESPEKLAERIRHEHPGIGVTVTRKRTLKITVRVPAKQRRAGR